MPRKKMLLSDKPEEQPPYTSAEILILFSITYDTLMCWLREKKLIANKFNGRLYFNRAYIHGLIGLERHRVEGEGDM